jgi:hypothetical protein
MRQWTRIAAAMTVPAIAWTAAWMAAGIWIGAWLQPPEPLPDWVTGRGFAGGFIGCVDGHVEVRNIMITGLTNDRSDAILDLRGVRCATEEEVQRYEQENRLRPPDPCVVPSPAIVEDQWICGKYLGGPGRGDWTYLK